MYGFRFYLEHESKYHKRRGEDMGTVIAVDLEQSNQRTDRRLVAAIPRLDDPARPYIWGNPLVGIIENNCKKISEQEAREIAPEVFDFLAEEEFDAWEH